MRIKQFRSWFMVHGSWFMVHGSWFTCFFFQLSPSGFPLAHISLVADRCELIYFHSPVDNQADSTYYPLFRKH